MRIHLLSKAILILTSAWQASCGNGFGSYDIGRKASKKAPEYTIDDSVKNDQPIKDDSAIKDDSPIKDEPIKDEPKPDPIPPPQKTPVELFFENNSGIWLTGCNVNNEKNTSWLSSFALSSNEITLSYLDFYNRECTGPRSSVYFEQFKAESVTEKNGSILVKAKCLVSCPQYKYFSFKVDKILFVTETNEGFNQNVKTHQFQSHPIK